MRIPVENLDKASLTLAFKQRYPKGHALEGRPHYGVDYSPKSKEDKLIVVAPCAGIVTRAGHAPNFGYHVRIQDEANRTHILAHLESLPIVRLDEYVSTGKQLGWASTHVHWEIRTSSDVPPPKGCRISPLVTMREENIR